MHVDDEWHSFVKIEILRNVSLPAPCQIIMFYAGKYPILEVGQRLFDAGFIRCTRGIAITLGDASA